MDFCLASRDTRLPKDVRIYREDADKILPVILHDIGLTQLSEEVLIVCNDDQLEVRVVLPLVDNTAIVS